jgi:hypothetical protein
LSSLLADEEVAQSRRPRRRASRRASRLMPHDSAARPRPADGHPRRPPAASAARS